MTAAASRTRLDAQACLAWEATQPERHEVHAGEAFAMTGAGQAHATIAPSAAVALRRQRAGSRCRVFAADMKLRIDAVDFDAA